MSAPTPPVTVITGGRVVDGIGGRLADIVAVRGSDIAYVGPAAGLDRDLAAGARLIDAHGAAVTPGFVDGHAHVQVSTLAHISLDLTDVRNAEDLLGRIAVARASGAAVILGHGWYETAWRDPRLPTLAEIDRAVGGRDVYLSRSDIHSALVSPSLVARAGLRDLPGWNGTAQVSKAASGAARRAAENSQDLDWSRDQGTILELAAAAGLVGIAEDSGPDAWANGSLPALLAITERAEAIPARYPLVLPYYAQLADSVEAAREALALVGPRVVGLGGDLSVDGALGSATAAVRDPFVTVPSPQDPDNRGALYLDVAAVSAHLIATTGAGIQGGFHVIGDRGLDTVIAGLEAAEAAWGLDAVRASRHRLEHIIITWPEQIAALARFGVIGSMQPGFDGLWGGPGGQYAKRLGPERLAHTHQFRALADAGVPLAFGSDAPVTPFAPWLGVRAAVSQADPAQRLSLAEAFTAHTAGAWAAFGTATRARPAGTLQVGAPAHLVVWEGDLPADADSATRVLEHLTAAAPQARDVVVGGAIVRRGGEPTTDDAAPAFRQGGYNT